MGHSPGELATETHPGKKVLWRWRFAGMHVWARECQRLTANSRTRQRPGTVLPLQVSEGAGPCQHLDFGLGGSCCSKPASLCHYVTTALARWHREVLVCWLCTWGWNEGSCLDSGTPGCQGSLWLLRHMPVWLTYTGRGKSRFIVVSTWNSEFILVLLFIHIHIYISGK